ncbi:MAG TPA: WbuC family cupin fold metalloprotein [Rhodocyclaceae bacterium]|nr:WbuC family cupin fold metalloprotein [Rhodocyclaceae bacterium]
MITLIDQALLDALRGEALQAPRLRKNRNFHSGDDFPAHRLLNAMEPGSYIAPHRHLDPRKDETMAVLRGRLGLVLFDDAGRVVRTEVLAPGGPAFGVDIVHGTWHTVLALEPGTVFLEAKAGPYRPFTAEERSPWAPAENSPEVGDYLARLTGLFK